MPLQVLGSRFSIATPAPAAGFLMVLLTRGFDLVHEDIHDAFWESGRQVSPSGWCRALRISIGRTLLTDSASLIEDHPVVTTEIRWTLAQRVIEA